MADEAPYAFKTKIAGLERIEELVKTETDYGTYSTLDAPSLYAITDKINEIAAKVNILIEAENGRLRK